MSARERAAGLALMGFDVDGVLTDGKLHYTSGGDEIKSFSSIDGHGIKMLQAAGIEVVIISGRESRALQLRASNLGITELHMAVADKRACLGALLAQRGFGWQQAGYMGDDVVDLPVLRACGFSATTADGYDFVKQHVHFVSNKPGGSGAVREVCDLILDSRGALAGMLAHYLD